MMVMRLLRRLDCQEIDVGTVDGYQVYIICSTYMYAYTHTHIHTHAHAHTHTHLCSFIQGKEKDVTILSCVRAKNTSGSIGYVLWDMETQIVLFGLHSV